MSDGCGLVTRDGAAWRPVLSARADTIALLAAAVALPLLRDLVARQAGSAALVVLVAGYSLLLGLALAVARRHGYDCWVLGIGRDRLLLRLGGGALLGLLLALPALPQGVVPAIALRALSWALPVSAIEELFFRGVLLPVTREAFGAIPGLWLTSTAFALAHAAVHPWPALALGLVVAMLLGIWRLAWHDLVGPTIAHAIADAVAAGALAW